MKNLFLSLAFTAMTVGVFASNDIKTYSATFNEDLGTCHIVIQNTQTGETVVDVELPANSAEACEKMLKDTLDALN